MLPGIDRDVAPGASFLLCAGTFALCFTACALGTFFVEDWYAYYPNLFETRPDAQQFFWRPVTLVYAALCFFFTVRLWWFLRTEGAIPVPALGVPYLASVALPLTGGLWFAAYSVVLVPTVEKNSPAAILMMWGPTAATIFFFACMVFRWVVETAIGWWEETF